MLHPPNNVKSMSFFMESITFPIVLYATNEWEEQQMEYIKGQRHTAESLCKWCITHDIAFQILYPIHLIDILRHPFRYMDYLKLKNKLRVLKEKN